MTSGGRNLFILGFMSIVLAVVTAGASLAIYHNTGDIYLDRSRPGFLPDEEELEDDDEVVKDDYKFPQSGSINEDALNEFLEKIQIEVEALDAYEEPFSAETLSDKRFGL